MIYTIGYARLTPARLQEIVEGLDALLFDVRHVPRSRKPGFSASSLMDRFDWRYQSWGLSLGGSGNTSPDGIRALKQVNGFVTRPVILMCLEESPGECHRHHDICGQHFPDAIHIYQDELLTARSLQNSITRDVEYDIEGSLSDLLNRPPRSPA